MNWTDRWSVLTEPRDRYHLPPIVVILWVTIILAALWAGIVAIAWAVWHLL